MFVDQVERSAPMRSRTAIGVTLDDEHDLRFVRETGAHLVVIDIAKGLDVLAEDAAPVTAETEAALVAIADAPVAPGRATLAEEIVRAREIHRRALAVVKVVMLETRLRRRVGFHRVAPVVHDVIGSIDSNPDALLGLARIGDKSEHLFRHAVSVCVLLVAFCRFRGIEGDTLYQAGLGGLLLDIGKALVPEHVLNKPNALTEEELRLLRQHPGDGHQLLSAMPDIGDVALDIALHHHERFNGNGYPFGKSGAETSELAQMAAIVDCYCKLTVDTPRQVGVDPAQALRIMYERDRSRFDPALLQSFIRCVGIYPVGTLVLLESKRLAVVLERHPTSLLTPKVRVFFDAASLGYLKPSVLDLSSKASSDGGDRIVRHEQPVKWNFAPLSIAALA